MKAVVDYSVGDDDGFRISRYTRFRNDALGITFACTLSLAWQGLPAKEGSAATPIERVSNASSPAAPHAELVAIARLPADTLVPGPTSGQFLDPAEKATNFTGPPYPDAQPVQGFSAIVDEGAGRYLLLADNGFGSKANSADFVLSIYRIRPEFRTAEGGAGVLHIESRIILRDPDQQLPNARVADSEYYPGSETLRVPESMRQRLWLTGADLDPESLQRLEGGHYWIGDEFGPFLLHFGRSGKLLDPPFSLPGFHSEDSPLLTEQANALVTGQATGLATVSRSGGFEGLAFDREKGILYPMLEKAVPGNPGVLEIFAFDIAQKQFLPIDQPTAVMRYPLDEGALAAGAFQYLGNGEFLVLERDGEQGAAANVKRIYRVQQGEVNEQGLLRKQLLVDLLQIADAGNLSGAAQNGVFAFAYETIESLLIMDSERLAVVNDNNFPFGNGPGGSDAEETVFAVIWVPILAAPFKP